MISGISIICLIVVLGVGLTLAATWIYECLMQILVEYYLEEVDEDGWS